LAPINAAASGASYYRCFNGRETKGDTAENRVNTELQHLRMFLIYDRAQQHFQIPSVRDFKVWIRDCPKSVWYPLQSGTNFFSLAQKPPGARFTNS
jgi:hypothetical protein